MRLTPAARVRIAAAASIVSVLTATLVVRAQFTPPSCVPPFCNPEVIQNIDVDTGTAQVADINITGDAKLGAKFQVGANAPVLTQASENLYYGNVGGTSTNGSLLLLQFGSADRLRVGLTGQLQLPTGSAGAPSYTFLTDTNTGFYSTGADSVGIATNGVIRTTVANGGTTINSGVLSAPTGSAGAPSYTFTGDTNTGMYRSAADTLNLATAGVSRLQIDSTGLVTIPGALTVLGTFTASGGIGGDGSALTNLNASNITTGTLNDARLSSNVALLDRLSQTFTGNNTFSGMTSLGSAALVAGAGQNMLYGVADSTSTGNLLLLQTENAGAYTDRFQVTASGAVIAASFAGVGSALTSLNASNLASGTVPSARISGTYANNLTFSGMTSFGSATRVVSAGQNLIYGNVDTTSTGNLLLLQNESVDRFRVDSAGNLSLSGTINASGSLTSGGVGVCLQDGSNCPASLGGGGTGSGTDGYISRFTGASTLGDSAIYQDSADNIGIGTTTPSGKLSVNGSITAQGVSTYLVAAGATGVVGQVVGTGSTGVAGSGSSYGVYGSSGGYGVYGYNTSAGATGAGVYGYGSGTSPGVQGSSAGGWGGSFSSLYVTPGTAYFASGASMGSGMLTLGNLASAPTGANGGMYYDTALASFRCYSGGAWNSCGVGGSGTTNYVAKFTGSGTIGNSLIRDDGTGVAIGGTPAAGAQLVVGPTNQNNALTATTNANNGVGIYGFGMGTSSIGLYGQGQGAGVFGLGGGAGGVGLQGTGSYAGVTGTTANVWGYGVLGTVPAGSYVHAVYGITGSSQYTSAGVAGVNSGNGMGGYFQSNNATTYALLAYNGGNPTTGYAFQAQGASNFTGPVSMNSTLTVGGVSVCLQSGTNCPPVTEADTLATVTGRGATTTTAISVTSAGTAISGSGAGTGVYGTAGSNGGIGVQGAMTATGGYGVYGTSSGSGGNGVYGNAGASNGIGVNGLGGYIGVAGTGPYGVYGDGASSGTYAAGVYGTGYHGVEGVAENNGYGVYGTGYYGVYGGGSYMGLYGAGGTYGVYANGTSYGVYARSTDGYGLRALSSNSYGIYSSGYDTGGYFTNAWGVGVHIARYGGGMYSSGYDSGGHFYDLNGTSEGWVAEGGYAFRGIGVIYTTGDVNAPSNTWGSGSGWVSCGGNGQYCVCPNGSYVGQIYNNDSWGTSASSLQAYCYEI